MFVLFLLHLVFNLSADSLLSNYKNSRFVAASSNEIGRSHSSADIASKFTISQQIWSGDAPRGWESGLTEILA